MNSCILIDDDAIINLIHTKMIKNLPVGFEVISFQDPVAGVRFFEDFEPESGTKYYVFIDLNMPGLNGWSILEKLSDSPIIDHLDVYILSSSTNENDKERARQHPYVKQYLEKPLLETLLEELMLAA